MLQKLNERIQGLVAWVVVGLIAITFVMFGVDYYMQSRQVSTAIAEVNGEPISKQSYETHYRRALQQRQSSLVKPTNEKALKKQVLEDLIAQEVSLQAAKHNGFNVTVEEANAAILQIPQFQDDGHFSLERYQQALNNAMFTQQSFQHEVRQGMLLNQQRFAFIGSAFALPTEIERFVKLYMQTRDYDYLKIPVSLFQNNVNIPDSALLNYYQKHQNEFISPEKVSIDYVKLSMQDVKESVVIGDEDIKRYYEDNKNNFLNPAQWRVSHILFSLPKDASLDAEKNIKQQADNIYQQLRKNPEKFDEMLKAYSADKLSLVNHGLLPWLVAGQTEFDKTLFKFTQVGKIYPPIKSALGFEIFKLIDYKPAQLKSLDEVQSDIKQQLLSELAQAKYAQMLEQLNSMSYESPDSLDPIASSLNLKIHHTKLFSRHGGQDPVTKNKDIIHAAFNHDVLELHNNSEPIQLDNEDVLVLRVNQHTPVSEKPFNEVKSTIANQLALKNASEKAQQLGERILLGKSGDDSSKENRFNLNQLKWSQVNKATRDSEKSDSRINELAFRLNKTNNQGGLKLSNGDYVVVRLRDIHDGELSQLDKEQQENIAQQIASSDGLMDYELYMSYLLSKAKITRH